MLRRSGIATVLVVVALVVAACGDDGGSLLEQASNDAPTNQDSGSIGDLPTDVGDIPGVSGECEALLNLFLSIGGAFIGTELLPFDSNALASAPPEIRADAAVVFETLNTFNTGVQDLGVDMSDPASFATMTEAQQEAFSALTDSLDTDEFNDAADSLTNYAEQACDNFGPVG